MLHIYNTLLDLIRDVAPIANAIARHDKDLATQIRRALSSAVMNVAEGSDQLGRRRNSHYSVALGSSREALTGLRAATSWGYIAPISPGMLDAFDKVHATLFRVLHPAR
jgi:four helix bundle protein